MWLTKRNVQIAIGLIIFGLAMTTTSLPIRPLDFLQFMQELQFLATVALLFGIFKAHSKHKDKFLLLWLVITVYCALLMIKAGLRHWTLHLNNGRGSFTWVLLPWTMAAAVAYMWIIMYNYYVELTVEAPKAVDEAATAEQVQELTPPKYPNLENLTVLVHGKRLQ